jgi:hypothetical protein
MATGIGARSVLAIQAVVNGSSDTRNRCAKLIQISRVEAKRTSRSRW